MAGAQGLRQEIRETRRELTQLNAEFRRVAQQGAANGRTFGQKFKAAALTGVKEVAKGAAYALGAALVNRLAERGRSGGAAFGKSFKTAAKKEMDSVSRGGGGMKFNIGTLPIIGVGLLAAGIAAQLGGALQSAFEKERLTISFSALSADGGGGDRIFQSLRQEALRTGVAIEAMAGSVQRFMGLGFEESAALKLNRSLLDIAGALGMSTSQAGLLGTALAQVQAKGVASMEELRQQIAEKGVPVFEVLAQKLGVTEAAIIKMVGEGKVGADVVIEAFTNLEGPLARFAGGAARLGSSAGGLFARLKAEAGDLKMLFADELIPELKPVLSAAIEMIRGMKDEASAFGKQMAEAMGNVQAAFRALSLKEILLLAALTFKKEMLAGLNVVIRAGEALMATLADGSFEQSLEKAALRFKEIMLQAAAEIAESLSVGAGGRTKIALQNAAHFARGSADVAAAQREALPEGPGFASQFQKFFGEAASDLGLSPEEKADLAELGIKIRRQRGVDLSTRAPGPATPAPSGGGTSTTAAPASIAGLVGGGLANALSRIGGGPSTVLMTRQLDVMRGVKTAAEATAKSAADTVAAVKSLKRSGPVFS